METYGINVTPMGRDTYMHPLWQYVLQQAYEREENLADEHAKKVLEQAVNVKMRHMLHISIG